MKTDPKISGLDTTGKVVFSTDCLKGKGMAHKLKVKPVPHINKDGSASVSKKDWEVWDRSRGKKSLVGVATSQKGAQELIEEFWRERNWSHARHNPKDHQFLNKHARRVN